MAEVISVSALNRYVKMRLDADDVLFDLALRGEIANFVQNARSGHCYFTLRDDACSVKAVMFRSDAARLAFRPQEGMRVVVRCRATLYERDGAFQLYVNAMFPDGMGAAQLALEQLKEKLAKEGLFDPEHKKPLPAFPQCIGVVTSKTGAALQDIRNVIGRRWPAAKLLLCPVTVQGFEAAQQVADAIREDTCLVTVMYANNEIGSILPIEEIGAVCREKGVLFHTDAVQAAGHLPIDVQAQHIDMLSLSGHKFHGPKGVGALYVRGGIPLVNVIEGGAQERGKRAGTENVPGIAGMAAALEEACAHMEENRVKVTALRDRLIEGLSKIPHSAVNGDLEHRLPGNVNFCFEGIEGESLLLLLDAAGICASSGSACTSGSLDPSHVLLAIGRPHEVAHGSLRLSLCEWNTQEEVDHILREVPRVVEYLRSMSPVWKDLESGKKAFML